MGLTLPFGKPIFQTAFWKSNDRPYFKNFLLFALIGLIVHRLFSRSQKRAISEVVHISAWVLLAAAMLALGWYVWAAW